MVFESEISYSNHYSCLSSTSNISMQQGWCNYIEKEESHVISKNSPQKCYASMWYDYVITALFVSMWIIFLFVSFPVELVFWVFALPDCYCNLLQGHQSPHGMGGNAKRDSLSFLTDVLHRHRMEMLGSFGKSWQKHWQVQRQVSLCLVRFLLRYQKKPVCLWDHQSQSSP